jgi:hypothetical protein
MAQGVDEYPASHGALSCCGPTGTTLNPCQPRGPFFLCAVQVIAELPSLVDNPQFGSE